MRITDLVGAIILTFLCGCGSQISLSIDKHIAHGKLNDVIYYTGVSKKSDDDKAILFIRGTGRFNASQDFGMGAEATLFGFSIVYPQKSYVENEEEYYIHDHRDQRMHDIKAVIDDLILQGYNTIILIAESEGTMLAPEIAAQYKNHIRGLVCMAGSVFTFEEENLYAAEKKQGLFTDIQDVNNLKAKIKEIFSDPDNTEKDFMGHPYKFWSTYLRYAPMNDLKKLTCPILYLNGENENFDIKKHQYIIQQMNNKGFNISYKVYPGIGHKMKPIAKQLSRDILQWGMDNNILQSREE